MLDCPNAAVMFAPNACKRCGRTPAAGFAMIGDDRYCHGDGDPEPTCYMRATWDQANIDKQGFGVGRSARAPF